MGSVGVASVLASAPLRVVTTAPSDVGLELSVVSGTAVVSRSGPGPVGTRVVNVVSSEDLRVVSVDGLVVVSADGLVVSVNAFMVVSVDAFVVVSVDA